MAEDCPLCGKPVAGESALHGHLEFAHRIEDPALWVAERNAPASRRGWRRRRRESEEIDDAEAVKPDSPDPSQAEPVRDEPTRRPTPAPDRTNPSRAPEVDRPVVDRLDEDEDEAEARTWSSVEDDLEALRGTLWSNEERPEKSLPVEPDEPEEEPVGFRRAVRIAALLVVFGVLVIAALSLVSDDEPDEATATTTSVADGTTSSTRPPPPDDFREPFAFQGELLGCSVEAGQAVYELGFSFSGAMNITFDGVEYPDRSGNGNRTTNRRLPPGQTEYVDELIVLDAVGNEYPVELAPPVLLRGC